MKKILVPLDFSPASLNAFTYALSLAKKIGAEIVTTHIYEVAVATTVEFYDFLLTNYQINSARTANRHYLQLHITQYLSLQIRYLCGKSTRFFCCI